MLWTQRKPPQRFLQLRRGRGHEHQLGEGAHFGKILGVGDPASGLPAQHTQQDLVPSTLDQARERLPPQPRSDDGDPHAVSRS